MRTAIVLFGMLGLSAVAGGDPSLQPKPADTDRLEKIALTYVEAYETTRRFEEYARKNRDLEVNVLVDDAYYAYVFSYTNALDARGDFRAERLEDVRFKGTHFFRAYPTTISPPYPVFVVGVKTNGSVFRFRGFPDSDYDFMVGGSNAGSPESLDQTIRLYYRIHMSFDPGPILDDGAMREASRLLAEDVETERVSKELFLPRRENAAASTIVDLCLFDASSTRLEVHRIRVDPDGHLEILERRVVHDAYEILL